jgi:hypothetical protein
MSKFATRQKRVFWQNRKKCVYKKCTFRKTRFFHFLTLFWPQRRSVPLGGVPPNVEKKKCLFSTFFTFCKKCTFSPFLTLRWVSVTFLAFLGLFLTFCKISGVTKVAKCGFHKSEMLRVGIDFPNRIQVSTQKNSYKKGGSLFSDLSF